VHPANTYAGVMDTREKLHAVLDELDSDELPRPEALRRALAHSRSELPLDLIGALERQAGPHVTRGLEGIHLPFTSLWVPGSALDRERLAALTSLVSLTALTSLTALGYPVTLAIDISSAYSTAAQSILESLAKRRPLEQTAAAKEQALTENTGQEEQGHTKPRKLPRSMGMGKNGPPDLSEREGFGPSEAGTR
jgi:hypothetical protein